MTGVSGLKSLPQALQRRFDLIIFDWDGTAVPDRRTAVPELNAVLEELLLKDVWIAPVTGTNIDNLEKQSFSLVSSQARGRNLLICTNRGSEVWAYDASARGTAPSRGWPRRRKRTSSRPRRRVLQRQLRGRGLETEIIYKRLNRRKIDLIPLPEWADPPKSQIGDLIAATRSRVQAAGFAEISDVIALTDEIAVAAGLKVPRITSDGKYVEVGLTDKGDSVAWLLDQVARKNEIENERIVIAGDEFGDVGGFSGSDARMLLPEAGNAAFVSVGPEPAGVPAPVLKVDGGPGAFVEMLRWQLTLRGS